MQILRSSFPDYGSITGLAVSIDVLRAFTTAGVLFDQGVREIFLVSSVEEAYSLRDQMPDCLLLGEVDGIKVSGFDLGNSPTEILRYDLHEKRIIQRTTAGTQGVVLSTRADPILAAALTNVSATVRYIQQLAPAKVTLIQTGYFPQEGWGDEDVACADMIEALLLGQPVDLGQICRRVRASRSGQHYDGTRPDFPPNDLEVALAVDKFDFAMVVTQKDGLHILRKAVI